MCENEVKPTRIPELDYIKGIGIIVIAAYHLIFFSLESIPDHMINSLIWGYISVYFMLSGYTCRQDKNIGACYKSRILRLLLPALVLEIILLLIGGCYCMIFHGYKLIDVFHDTVVTFLRPELTLKKSAQWGMGGLLFNDLSPVWFIWSMIWTEFFFHPLRILMTGKSEKLWALLLVALVAIQIPLYVFLEPAPWCLTILPVYIIFMLVGTKLREWNAVERLRRLPAGHAVWITILCFGAHFGLFMLNGTDYFYASVIGRHGAWDVFTAIIQSLLITPALFFLVRGIRSLHHIKILEWMGKNTFPILLMHGLVGMVWSDILHVYSRIGEYWYLEWSGITLTFEILGKSVLVFLLTVLTCLPLAKLWDAFQKIIFKTNARGSGE